MYTNTFRKRYEFDIKYISKQIWVGGKMAFNINFIFSPSMDQIHRDGRVFWRSHVLSFSQGVVNFSMLTNFSSPVWFTRRCLQLIQRMLSRKAILTLKVGEFGTSFVSNAFCRSSNSDILIITGSRGRLSARTKNNVSCNLGKLKKRCFFSK